MNDSAVKLNDSMLDAVKQLRRHPSVSNVTIREDLDGGVIVSADFDTNLPSTWRAMGESPTGVRPIETVEYAFPSDYPRRAPVPTLRSDFNRNLPHINPHRRGARVPPCVIFGSALEVLHNEGVYRLYEQMALWLENAAENRLIDNRQGWEPMRRDFCEDLLEVDVDDLVKDKAFGNARLHRIRVAWSNNIAGAAGLDKRKGSATLTVNELAKATDSKLSKEFYVADSLFVVCWPESDGTGGPKIIEEYLPDNVESLSDLRHLAQQVGCSQALERFVGNINTVALSVASVRPVPIFVALAVRRPFHLIGLDSDYELLAYRFDIHPQKAPVLTGDAPAFAALITAPLTSAMLHKTSGLNTEQARTQVGMVGCGSLGSKVALHVARGGFAPSLLIDGDKFHEHNAARHALSPRQFNYWSNKANQLATVLAEFSGGRKPVVFARNITQLPFGSDKFRAFFADESSVLLNTTGSHSVRHFLTDSPVRTRVMEACLLNLGAAAVITLEGPGRNPSSTDLMAHAFEQLRVEGLLQPSITGHEAVVGVGVGCNSITLPMTDANISLVAAGVGQTALRLFQEGLPDVGMASVAHVSADKMSVQWKRSETGATHVANVSGNEGWSVRILDKAHQRICADVAQYPRVETGGVIVGRVSPTRREIVIVDVMEAPPDSKRSPMTFVLGVEGLSERIEAYNASGQGVLWCLGTWHSHLVAVGPSPTDIATANKLEGSIAGAVVLLIRRPDGYSAVVRDGF